MKDDSITFKYYLHFTKNGIVKLYKNQPTVSLGEVVFPQTMKIDKSWFEIPTTKITIEIPKKPVPTEELIIKMKEELKEITDFLGYKVEIK